MTDRNHPLFMISVAAELSGLHPQTLRIYETKGLVTPQRSSGNTRLYSQADIDRLELIGQLTAEGINLAGVLRIIDLERRLEELDEQGERLRRRLHRLEQQLHEYELRERITALARSSPQAIKIVEQADARQAGQPAAVSNKQAEAGHEGRPGDADD